MSPRDLENILNELGLQRFSPSALKTLGELIREKRGRGQGNRQAPVNPQRWGKNVQLLKAASATTGYLTQYNGYTDEWRDGTHLLQLVGVGGTPTAGERYIGIQTGKDASGRGKFTVVVPSGGGGAGTAAGYRIADTDTLHPLCSTTEIDETVSILHGGDGAFYCTPFAVAEDTTADEFVWRQALSTATNSPVYRVGLFRGASLTQFKPDALVADFGQFTFTNPESVVQHSQTVTFSKDVAYWAVFRPGNVSGGVVVFSGVGNLNPLFLNPLGWDRSDYLASFTKTLRYGWYFSAGAIAALPDPFPGGGTFIDETNGFDTPLILARFSA